MLRLKTSLRSGRLIAIGLVALMATSARAEDEARDEPAAAPIERFLSLDGGFFVPWDGSPGMTLGLRFARTLGRHSRVGVEFEYQDFEYDLYGKDELGVQLFSLRSLLEYHFRPAAPLDLYLGLGGGLSALRFGDGFSKTPIPGTEILSLSGIGLAGIVFAGAAWSVPAVPRLSLYGEGRFAQMAVFSWIENFSKGKNDQWHLEGLGGFSAQAGLRWRF